MIWDDDLCAVPGLSVHYARSGLGDLTMQCNALYFIRFLTIYDVYLPIANYNNFSILQ